MTSLSATSTAVEDGKYEEKGLMDSVKPPIYKRKKVIAAAVLAAAVVIVVAVTVPVVVLRNKHGHYSTGINGAFEMKRPTGPYTDVIVFGDGHADNGRPREEQYAASRAPNSIYWDHRWTDGPTWPEFLHGLMQTRQAGNGSTPADARFSTIENRNYAYGWSSLLGTNALEGSINLTAQVDTYLADLANNSTASDPSRHSLICFQAGMLDVYNAFERYLSPGSSVHGDKTSAVQSVQQAAHVIIENAFKLEPGPERTDRSLPDFVVMPLHPLELSPRAGRLARMYGGNVDTLRDLTVEFNKVLMANGPVISRGENTGNVYTYDVPNWLYNTEDDFRIDGCLEESCWGVWWSDPMHLSYGMHRILAEKIASAMLGEPVSVDRSQGYSQYYTWSDIY